MSAAKCSALAFRWGQLSHHANSRTYYDGFTLQQTRYDVGALVYLLPEEQGAPLFIGRLLAAFIDSSAGKGSEAYSIEVRWFERMPDREVVELDETDVNPAGCLAGIAPVVFADTREQAEVLAAKQGLSDNWFFCRRLFQHATSQFLTYPVDQLTVCAPSSSAGKRRPEEGADSGDTAIAAAQHNAPVPNKRQNKGRRQSSPDGANREAVVPEPAELPAQSSPAAPKQQQHIKGKGPGQQCVECGATQTPQWREGPAGPKTLCNACGVRYNRLRANKRGGGLRQFHGRSKSARNINREPCAILPAVAPAAFCAQDCVLPAVQELPLALPLPGQQRRQQQQQQGEGVTAPSASGRPVRQAALASASRTAAIARLGVLAEDDEERDDEDEQQEDEERDGKAGAEAELAAVLRCGGAPGVGAAAAPSSGSTRGGEHQAECSLDSSRSSQGRLEPLGVPTPTPTPAPVLQQLQAVGLHSAGSSAAFNLLCGELPVACMDSRMELDPATPGTLSGALDGLHGDAAGTCLGHLGCGDVAMASAAPLMAACPISSTAAGEVLRRAAVRAASYCPDAAEFGGVFSSLEALQATLPPESLQQLTDVAQQVEAVAGEAADAEAELQAVAQLLAARQKTASASRERAVSAVQRLKSCMSDLVQKHGHCTSMATFTTAEVPAATTACAGLLEHSLGGGLGGLCDLLPSHDFSDLLGVGLSMDCKLRAGGVPWSQVGLDNDPLLDSSSLLGLGGDNGASLLCVDGSLC